MKTIYTILTLLISGNAFSQIAPNFTLTDINGESHELYEYLDAGTTVILDFYAEWCGPCQVNAAGVEEVYLDLGPEGANDIMILGIEGDDDSTDEQVAQYAIDYNCSNPQINNSENVMDLYDISYYPTYLVVCPDRSFAEYEGVGPEEIEVELNVGIELCEEFEGEAIDARLFAYNSGTTLCTDETTPNITLMNMGSEPLTSVEIITYLNGEQQDIIVWINSLGLYDFEFITLPTINLNGVVDPEITVLLQNPNGVVDPNPDNDSVTVDIEYGGSNYPTEYIRFELYFDNFPQETSWEFKNSAGEIVVSGDDYIGFPDFSPPIDTLLELPYDDCYTFTIYDEYGDGICCAFADPDEGFWKISSSDGILIAEGGVFTDEESAIFGVIFPIGISEIEKDVAIYPNPAQNNVTISGLNEAFSWEIISMDGRSILNGLSKDFRNNQIDISSINSSGTYILSITIGEQTFFKKLVVE